MQAAAVILAGRTRLLDLGTVNELPFFNVASLGLTVARDPAAEQGIMKRRFGVLAYPVAAAVAVLRSGRFRASLRADGEEIAVEHAADRGRQRPLLRRRHDRRRRHRRSTTACCTSTASSPSPLAAAVHGARVPRRRARQLRDVRTFRCKTMTVTTRRPRDVCADGEFITRTPANFAVLPQAVRVFVP